MRVLKPVLFVMCLFFLIQPSVAQDKPSQFLHLYEFHINPTNVDAFEAYVKKVAEAAQQTGASQHWMTFSGGLGTHSGTYFIAIPSQNWAELDGWSQVPAMLAEAFGEEEGKKVWDAGRAAIGANRFSLETYALMSNFTTNYDASRYVSNFYQLIRTEVKPEMNPAYMSILARAAKIAEGAEGGPMTIRRANVMGSNFRYIAATPFNQFSDVDGMGGFWQTMNEKMGELAADEFFDTLRKSIVKREMFIIMLRRDLSRLP